MSKKQQNARGDKKHKKALKRKGRHTIYTNKVKFSSGKTVEERLAFRVNRAIKNARSREYEQKDTMELVAEAKEKVKELRFIHYYLIFARILFDNNLLEGSYQYDIVKVTHLIKAINEQLNIIHLLEDEAVIQVELYDIGEKIVQLADIVGKVVPKLEPFQTYISNVILHMGRKLPERPDGRPREMWEIENEVLRIQAIEYIATNVYNTSLTKGNEDE